MGLQTAEEFPPATFMPPSRAARRITWLLRGVVSIAFVRGAGDNKQGGKGANQCLMIPLVDRLVAAGKLLRPGHCYSYVLSPVLGGDYTVENTMVIPICEHYSLHASIHEQIKELPDGAAVRIRSGRKPAESDAESQ